MKPIVELIFLSLLACVAVAQTPGSVVARIRSVHVANGHDGIRIELGLTIPITPRVITTIDPDRLVMDLPNTQAQARQQHIDVNHDGVIRVRVGLNAADPPVTRVVVDLANPHTYEVKAMKTTIILTVRSGTATSVPSDGAVPAASTLLDRKWPWPHSKSQSSASWTANAKVSARGKLRTSFKVKYVAEGAAYLDGGRSSGLKVGMKLIVRDAPGVSGSSADQVGGVVAELQIVSVAATSAVTEIHSPKREVEPGDWAYLSPKDSARLSGEQGLVGTDKLPAASSFAAGGEPAQSTSDSGSHPAALEESRLGARVAVDYSGIHSSGSTLGSSGEIGLAVRADMKNIAGTHWNLEGYWRDRLTTNSQPDEETIQDYLDRTYIIQLSYDNPDSKWVAGFGRLYLPWAVSLDTIDGGYVGRKIGHGITTGVFGGSTPDPTSWNYQPDQQILGSFVNFEGGNYDSFHYSSTAGVAFSMLKWQLDRPYLFLDNTISYSKYLSIYHSLIVDSPQGVTTDGIKPGAGISRSYLTFHVQPKLWIGFDVYHNYFRDVPTAATALIGTGMVDKLLYQGLSAGVRIKPVRHFSFYTTLGKSDKTGDARESLNQMYGVTWSEIAHTGIRADLHYSKFDSSFARGDYRVLSLSRHLGDRMNWDAQFGSQTLLSAFTSNNKSMFFDTSLDTNLGRRTFIQSGITLERGATLNYQQWYMSLGYRFDVKGPAK